MAHVGAPFFLLSRVVARLFSLLSELTSNFYRDQVRRMRLKVERRTYTHVELSVRYYFKVCCSLLLLGT